MGQSKGRILAAVVFSITSPRCLGHSFTGADDEYDFRILDPESPHGSPYGGFSRATASRLASLPLRLPHIDESADDYEPFYVRLRDFLGRPFSCRVYHEDELDPKSLSDGMFESPILKGQNDPPNPDAQTATATQQEESTLDGGQADGDEVHDVLEQLEQRLSQLQGMCAQFHQGWWSYEWCFDGSVTQFHIDVKTMEKGDYLLTVEDVTSLGKFQERKAVMSAQNRKDAPSSSLGQRGKKSGDVEAIEVFGNGDICPETGKPRETTAVLTCCPSPTSTNNRKSLLYERKSMTSDLVFVNSVLESKEQVCTYTVTVCTPLLCGDDVPQGRFGKISALKSAANVMPDTEEIEKMSIAEILDMSFGVEPKKCVLDVSGLWWVYELCPGHRIRQFHELNLLDRATGMTSTAVETEYILGKYDPTRQLPKDREWENVVNTTTLHTASSTGSRAISRPVLTSSGENGAYYYEEYIGGDLCDHKDVTDSAIKAGEVGKGVIERSTTVKYGCGNQLQMTVTEDTTCHYVASVSIPALCHHPLFRPPVSKKQVIKCILEVAD